jgi:AcrR family transcriptional regulator
MSTQGTTTRERLLSAATDLFAARGYQNASVRDICDVARANPGAVSYHFGGKRFLYRATVRRTVDQLVEKINRSRENAENTTTPPSATIEVINEILLKDHTTVQLVLRDLADGGAAFLEGVSPHLRPILELAQENRADPRSLHSTILTGAAALLLVHAGWPVLNDLFGLDESDRVSVLRRLLG